MTHPVQPQISNCLLTHKMADCISFCGQQCTLLQHNSVPLVNHQSNRFFEVMHMGISQDLHSKLGFDKLIHMLNTLNNNYKICMCSFEHIHILLLYFNPQHNEMSSTKKLHSTTVNITHLNSSNWLLPVQEEYGAEIAMNKIRSLSSSDVPHIKIQ